MDVCDIQSIDTNHCDDSNNSTFCGLGQACLLDFTTCCSCPAGTYSSNGLYCVPCDIGTYSDTSGSFSCLQCPLGKTSSHNGSTSCQDFISTLSPTSSPITIETIDSSSSMKSNQLAVVTAVTIFFIGFVCFLLVTRCYLMFCCCCNKDENDIHDNSNRSRAQLRPQRHVSSTYIHASGATRYNGGNNDDDDDYVHAIEMSYFDSHLPTTIAQIVIKPSPRQTVVTSLPPQQYSQQQYLSPSSFLTSTPHPSNRIVASNLITSLYDNHQNTDSSGVSRAGSGVTYEMSDSYITRRTSTEDIIQLEHSQIVFGFFYNNHNTHLTCTDNAIAYFATPYNVNSTMMGQQQQEQCDYTTNTGSERHRHSNTMNKTSASSSSFSSCNSDNQNKLNQIHCRPDRSSAVISHMNVMEPLFILETRMIDGDEWGKLHPNTLVPLYFDVPLLPSQHHSSNTSNNGNNSSRSCTKPADSSSTDYMDASTFTVNNTAPATAFIDSITSEIEAKIDQDNNDTNNNTSNSKGGSQQRVRVTVTVELANKLSFIRRGAQTSIIISNNNTNNSTDKNNIIKKTGDEAKGQSDNNIDNIDCDDAFSIEAWIILRENSLILQPSSNNDSISNSISNRFLSHYHHGPNSDHHEDNDNDNSSNIVLARKKSIVYWEKAVGVSAV